MPQSVVGWRTAVFFLRLPTPITVPHHTVFTYYLDPLPGGGRMLFSQVAGRTPYLEREAANSASFRFWQVKVDLDPFKAIDAVFEALLPKDRYEKPQGPNADSPEVFATVVEATTMVPELNGIIGPTEAEAALDRCVTALGEWIDAYAISTNHAMPRITRLQLPFVVPWISRSTAGTDWDERVRLLLVHPNAPPLPKKILNKQGLEKLAVVASRYRRGDPLYPVNLLRTRLRRARQMDGDFSDTAVYAQMLLEVLMDTVLTLLLWEEGMDPSEAANQVFHQSLPVRLQQQIAPRLKGRWDWNGAGPIGDWGKELRVLRNRVVHGGYRPTEVEADRTLVIAHAVDEHLRVRLARSWQKYRRSALLVIGKPGFQRKGQWHDHMERWIKSQAEPDWIVSYQDWRKEFDASLLQP